MSSRQLKSMTLKNYVVYLCRVSIGNINQRGIWGVCDECKHRHFCSIRRPFVELYCIMSPAAASSRPLSTWNPCLSREGSSCCSKRMMMMIAGLLCSRMKLSRSCLGKRKARISRKSCIWLFKFRPCSEVHLWLGWDIFRQLHLVTAFSDSTFASVYFRPHSIIS